MTHKIKFEMSLNWIFVLSEVTFDPSEVNPVILLNHMGGIPFHVRSKRSRKGVMVCVVVQAWYVKNPVSVVVV